MVDVDWVFLKSNKTKEEVTLQEAAVPHAGDGKHHDKIGYVVRYIVSGRTTSPNDLVIATEV